MLPHPGWKSLKGRRRIRAQGQMPDISVDGRRVRPVGFHPDNGKTVPLDQAPRDRGAGAIELRRPVAGLAERDDTAIGEAVKQRAEARMVEVRQRLRGSRDHLRSVSPHDEPAT
jgi:hypothetical protein